MRRGFLALALIGMSILPSAAARADAEVDAKISAYQKVGGVAGNLSAIGSDTLNNVMTMWAESFRNVYPSVQVQVEGKGSSTAPPALIAGTAQLGPMSREMKADELDAFEKKFGYPPTQFRVAIDALAVYVNKDNPIACLTVQEINRMFSVNRRAAFGGEISTWGEVGLTGEWKAKPIVFYGRNTISGTYGFFKEMALYGGDFKPDVRQQSGSEEVVQHVANDRYAIGYSGIGYKTDGVRAVPLDLGDGGGCHDTSQNRLTQASIRSRDIYTFKKPNESLGSAAGRVH